MCNHLVVHGSAYLDGNLTLIYTPGVYIPNPLGGLVGATDGISGVFASASLPPGRTLQYTWNSVDLV